MTARTPRVVVVVRESEYELLLARHATHAQASFFLSNRGQAIEDVQQRHRRFTGALQKVGSSIPAEWRRTRVLRHDLDRFAFGPDDIVVIVGPDGLVANTSKYLEGQPVLGINPDAALYDGVLTPHAPEATSDLLSMVHRSQAHFEERTMVQATLDDGQQLLALNEVFIGVRNHQSARYRIQHQGVEERHSSSGLIVATGTGSTGWARSIHRERRSETRLPTPTEEGLTFFVREAFPSVATGTDLTEGVVDGNGQLQVVSEINEGGVIFGDGIEADHLVFDWGQTATICTSRRKLHLVAPH